MWTALDAYARRHRVGGDRFERFASIIRQVDREYLKVSAEMAKAAAQTE
jgi:hypothetical protein